MERNEWKGGHDTRLSMAEHLPKINAPVPYIFATPNCKSTEKCASISTAMK